MNHTYSATVQVKLESFSHGYLLTCGNNGAAGPDELRVMLSPAEAREASTIVRQAVESLRSVVRRSLDRRDAEGSPMDPLIDGELDSVHLLR